jgi:hypothetical protein
LIDQYLFDIKIYIWYSNYSWFTILPSFLILSNFHPIYMLISLEIIPFPISFHIAICCQTKNSYIIPGAILLGGRQFIYYIYILLYKLYIFYDFIFIFLSYSFYFFILLIFFLLLFSFPFSRELPPRMQIRFPWDYLFMTGGLATK